MRDMAVRQERKEKCPRIGLSRYSEYGALAGFNVDDCDEVAEGRRNADRQHGITRAYRSILIYMWFWKSRYRATSKLQCTMMRRPVIHK